MIFNISNGLSPKYTRQAETITPGDSEVVIPADTYLEGALTIAAAIKAGLYAWKKSSVSKVIKDPDNTSSSLFTSGVALTCYTGVAIENNEIVGTGAMTITLSNSTYSQFVGKYYNKNGELVHIRSQKNTNTFNYSILYLDNEYTFLEYVVSDNENAYPDGAVHSDGYYYEKVSDGQTADNFGFTKIAFGTFTVTSDTKDISIPHNLGVELKRLIILKTSENNTSSYKINSLVLRRGGSSTHGGGTASYDYHYSGISCTVNASSSSYSDASDDGTTFTGAIKNAYQFSSSASVYFAQGEEYHWIALA